MKRARAPGPPAGAARDGRPVVIVESPTKARTLQRFLGNRYVVCSSMGHVRDLPERRFGIDLENGFEPTYVSVRGKGQAIRTLRAATRRAPEVFLAPDPDREGEAIAWHLVHALKLPEDRIRRVTFHEITEKAVAEAFRKPTKISMDRVNAQQARRFLDRIVGYKLSPLLWKKVARGLSAGRVQSVAVRLLVEREQEIRAFKPQEYWILSASLRSPKGPEPFAAELAAIEGRAPAEGEFLLRNEAEAKTAEEACRPGPFIVASAKRRERVEKAPPPFTTSLLQQQASIRLHFSASRTMAIAQQLYEGANVGEEGPVGLITYMRTDSFHVADEAAQACREWVGAEYGPAYVPAKPPVRAAGKHAQEAHEAIRPTDVTRTPERVKPFLTDEQFRLYRLIWRRFVASQMSAARFEVAEIDVRSGPGTFRATGKVLRFDGYTRVAGLKEREDVLLPPVAEGEELALEKLERTQKFTQPPPRYTEASLVKALEKHGIGRPSTYAPILSTIQDRGYVRSEERKLVPTELGIIVTEKLVEHFADVMNTGFTAKMELELDRIEEAEVEWKTVLAEFWDPFRKDLDRATEEMTSLKNQIAEGEPPCEKCGKPMVIRRNRYGKFFGCSGYPECKTARPSEEESTNEICPRCQSAMRIRRNRWGRYVACRAYPECTYTRALEHRGRPLSIPTDFAEKCPECAGELMVRSGRRGPFIACRGYPNCRYTRNVPKEWYQAAPKPAAPEGDGPAA